MAAMKSRILKADDEKRLVWGEIVAPNRPFVPDPKHGGEVMYMTAEEIEVLAYDFMRRKQQVMVDKQHNHQPIPGCTIVESFIARESDPDFIPGSWVVCVHVDDDDTWKDIQSGKINGFSMESLVVKEEVEVYLEIPDGEVTGVTSETEDHTHKFKVKYDDDGAFLGGKTTTVNGHFHEITAPTHTQEAEGHTHRFSAVDNVKIIEIEE